MPDDLREQIQRAAQNLDVNPPKGVGEDALRWATFTIAHLQPEEGSIIVMKAPPSERNDEVLDEMTASMRHVLEEAGIGPVAFLHATPDFTINKLSKEQLKRFGYVYDPSARDELLENMETT